MPPINVKNSGTYKEASEVYVKDNGSWKEAQEVWAYDNGQWKLVHSAGVRININRSNNYNSLTGVYYSNTFTTGSDSSKTNPTGWHFVSVPYGATHLDFFMCGGGGSGGTAPQGASSLWIGTGGAAAPVLYGTLTVNTSWSTSSFNPKIGIKVGTGGSGRNSLGEGRSGTYSEIYRATSSNTILSSEQAFLQCPGGAGGRRGDGKHKRIMYQPGTFDVWFPIGATGDYQTLSWADDPSSSFNSPLNEETTAEDNGYYYIPSNRPDRTWLQLPARDMSLDNRYGYLKKTGGASTEVAEEDADSTSNSDNLHKRVLVWTQDAGWQFRYHSAYNTFVCTAGGSISDSGMPFYPDYIFTDASTNDAFDGFELGSVIAAPPKRATGYAGSFRGETDSSGVPQLENFSRTSGAQGTGTSLTGWSGDTPIRRGGRNGMDYGSGGDAGASYNNGSEQGTDGVVQVKFRTET